MLRRRADRDTILLVVDLTEKVSNPDSMGDHGSNAFFAVDVKVEDPVSPLTFGELILVTIPFSLGMEESVHLSVRSHSQAGNNLLLKA